MKSARFWSLLFLSLACTPTLFSQVSVLSLGAKGDGKTDDTAAIQKAIDSHSSVTFPKGTYRLTGTVTVDLEKTGFAAISGDGTASIVMEAAGPAFHFIGHHEGSADPTSFKTNVLNQERAPMVSGLGFVGKHKEADAIEATGTMQLTISRIVVRECRHAIHLTKRNRNVLISDCHLYHNTGIGVFYDQVNLHQSNIIGSHISYNAGGGVVTRGGEIRNLHIGTCDIEANHSPESPPSANVELDSTGGSTGEVTITGCTIQHTSKAPGSANIRINGAGNDTNLERRVGRRHTREGNVTITGNVFSDVRVNIEVRQSRGITITGNTFWEGFDQDLLIEDSERLVISNNNFDRNPRYLINGFKNAENNGIKLHRCRDVAFNGNVIGGVWRQQAAVEIKEGDRLMIANNSILDSDGIGLLLEAVENSVISGNLIRDDRPIDKRSTQPSLVIRSGVNNTLSANSLGNSLKEE